MTSLNGRNIIVGVSGGIAAYKAALLVRLLKKSGADVQIMMTKDASRFITPLTLGTLSEREVLIEVFPDNESGSWTKHIQLGTWADAIVVAPATATTCAKLASGVCDSMLTATVLSARCPVLVCPSMDHEMYLHPATQSSMEQLRALGYEIREPDFGPLASGLVGEGRLAEPEAIAGHLTSIIAEGPPQEERDPDPYLAGKRVLVTAGPTREPIDPVRFFSNHSTGKMGFEIARAARFVGADVTLVSGSTLLAPPAGIRTINVTSAADMLEAVLSEADADVIIMAAAVADYTPRAYSEQKIKKSEGDLSVTLRRTEDILARIAEREKPGRVVIGFALETRDAEENAMRKLRAKKLDWIVLNDLSESGAGFGTGTNTVTIIGADGSKKHLPVASKARIASRILFHTLAG